ncbi:MAG: hypothetical protein JOZ72_04985 [Alphaproteobacteria bacterium]|nr:hypothetical protein [Alphaproteobacteria bacterium]
MGVAIWIGAIVTGIVCAAVSQQLTDEFKAWTPWLVQRLLNRAVRRLPESLRARFEEEWTSHIDEVPGHFGKLVEAAGFIGASKKFPASFEGERHSHSSPSQKIPQQDYVYPAYRLYYRLYRAQHRIPVMSIDASLRLHRLETLLSAFANGGRALTTPERQLFESCLIDLYNNRSSPLCPIYAEQLRKSVARLMALDPDEPI